MIITVELVVITSHNDPFPFVARTFKIYSLSNFEVYEYKEHC